MKSRRSRNSREDNEQLEFLGDAVLGLVVTEHLYRMYPEFSEGAWTRLRSQFVSRPHLASVALAIGLGEFLRLGKGEEKSGGRKKPAILANAVESVIAAVYLDGGMESAVRLVRTWLLDETWKRSWRLRALERSAIISPCCRSIRRRMGWASRVIS